MDHRAAALAIAAAAAAVPATARAGPPFLTDDPEPVEYRHWELYLASQHARDDAGWSGTAPHFEVNYGLIPEVQLHLLVPLAYSAPEDGSAHYGFGDTELGMKLRFVKEGKWVPQIGLFPLIETPTGKLADDLGNGTTQFFVPIWLQKSFGPWTTYGGAGAWFDTGAGSDTWWFFGWEVQRQLLDWLTLGAEAYHTTAHGDEDADTAYNFGAILDFSDTQHLVFSEGRSIVGPVRFQCYVAWLVTLGPKD